MIWSDLDWEFCDWPIPDERLTELEQDFRVTFPKAFRECIRQCNGAYVRQSDFDIVGGLGFAITSGIGAILRFDVAANVSRVLDAWHGMGPHHDHKVVPFAETGGGDYICLDYRSGDREPKVAYYQHDLGTCVPIADTFESFISMLYTPADY